MQNDCFFVADYQHVSLIEYPGKISSIIFAHGCNLRCRYCHNPSLVRGQRGENRLADFLEYLKGKEIEAVAVTGGEPLLSAGLQEFLKGIKSMGLLVKLDTNGFSPDRLRAVCREGLVDYAAIDVKSFSADRLKTVVRTDVSQDSFYASVDVLRQYNVPFEFRHTIWEMPCEADVRYFAERTGCSSIFVQRIRPSKMLDKTFAVPFISDGEVRELLESQGITAVVR